MQRNDYPYDLHWTRHADRYLALVHAALAKNPDDPNLRAALRDAYQQEIDVLSDVIDLTTRT